eukprot:1307139-Rhodomonas_salina.7
MAPQQRESKELPRTGVCEFVRNQMCGNVCLGRERTWANQRKVSLGPMVGGGSMHLAVEAGSRGTSDKLHQHTRNWLEEQQDSKNGATLWGDTLRTEQSEAPSAKESLPSRLSEFCAGPGACAAVAKPRAKRVGVRAKNVRECVE